MKAEMRALPIIALVALLLAGCGQKGPLYLPADRQADSAAVERHERRDAASNDANDQAGEIAPAAAAPDAPEDES